LFHEDAQIFKLIEHLEGAAPWRQVRTTPWLLLTPSLALENEVEFGAAQIAITRCECSG
jgi:hypothetical protein